MKFLPHRILAFTAIFALTALADDVIVQWGNEDGDVDIVTGNPTMANVSDSYISGTFCQPPALYYTSTADDARSKVFNYAIGANDGTPTNFRIVNNDSGDVISFLYEKGPFDGCQGMVAWESLLTGSQVLSRLEVQTQIANTDFTPEFRWLLQKKDGAWYTTDPVSITELLPATVVLEDPASAKWYDFTPLTGGTAIIGNKANIAMSNTKSVGLYVSWTGNTRNWTWVGVRYFKAEGILQRTVSLQLLH